MQLALTNVEYFRRHQTASEELNYWGKDKNFFLGGKGGGVRNGGGTAGDIFAPSKRPHNDAHSSRTPGYTQGARAHWCHKIAIGHYLLQTELKNSILQTQCSFYFSDSFS